MSIGIGSSYNDPPTATCLKLSAEDVMLPKELAELDGQYVDLGTLFRVLLTLQTKTRDDAMPDRYIWEIDSLTRTIRVQLYDPYPNE